MFKMTLRLQVLHSYHLISGTISSQWNYLIRQWKSKVKTKTETVLTLESPEKIPRFYVTFHFIQNLECSGTYFHQSGILTNFETLFLVFSTQLDLECETTEISKDKRERCLRGKNTNTCGGIAGAFWKPVYCIGPPKCIWCIKYNHKHFTATY